MSSLHRGIKLLRTQRGWSQAKLAKKAGLSRATIISAEDEDSRHGKNSTTLDKIAQALGFSGADSMWDAILNMTEEALADA